MSEFNFTKEWSLSRSKHKVEEIKNDLDEANSRMSNIDKKIKELKREKAFWSKKVSHNTRYKNAICEDIYQRFGESIDKL